MASLLDLLPIAKESVALPVPGYSLKVIEKYVHRATSCTRTQVEIDVSFSCPSASIRGTARADGREDFVRPELGSHGEAHFFSSFLQTSPPVQHDGDRRDFRRATLGWNG